MQHEVHVGERVAELGDDMGQRIARLRVRGRHVELAAILVRELLAELLDVLRIEQNAFDDANELPPGLSQAQQALAAPDEQLYAKLVLEILDVLRHTGLRCVESVGDVGEIEIALYRLTDDAKLLEVHLRSFSPNRLKRRLLMRTASPVAKPNAARSFGVTSTSK